MKRPLTEVIQYSYDEVGFWLAFFKLKQKREEEALAKARKKSTKK